ncbi:Na+/H+ antiporter NhaC family protein [Lacrimispora sp. NSJ-141]|uniref:Na+/H+ antiporter NhaC family protein n=1 Tax=Lientehia hominis TaxID=2897778 RepID=A0AAP2RIH7_9FIRM|nr:Na+/H+ antiporter NhaC family protein [Lientehia hominis]MCD2492824.1 Na+/H+ antiporter NhaC family protein [Lientehia hominis]
MEKVREKGNIWGLLPIGVFLVLFLGVGLISGDFYAMPAIVAFLIALLVAFVQNRKLPFSEKLKVIAKGVGDENIITMCLIFLAAGAFSGAVKAAGGADSTVALGLYILPPKIAVAGLMLIGCFMSISMGTSMGTIGALAPIAVGISQKTGFSMAICIGAVVSGAMFGDNLSMISDTTIAAVRTQGCEMRDKFRENFLLVLPAAVVSLVIYVLISRNTSFQVALEGSFNLWQVLPYIAVLIGALAGVNVFLVLIGGTVLSLIAGAGTGTIALSQMFSVMGEGVTSMYDITVISIIVACIVSLVKKNGGITCILNLIHKRIHGKKGGELGIAVLSVLVDMAMANNTVAIVIAGPIAKEISTDYGISPRRTASLLDIFASVTQGLIPYGAQLLLAAGQTGLSPLQIIPYTFYPVIMGVTVVIFIMLRKQRQTE